MCVLKTGFLFVASEFGNQWVNNFTSVFFPWNRLVLFRPADWPLNLLCVEGPHLWFNGWISALFRGLKKSSWIRLWMGEFPCWSSDKMMTCREHKVTCCCSKFWKKWSTCCLCRVHHKSRWIIFSVNWIVLNFCVYGPLRSKSAFLSVAVFLSLLGVYLRTLS